MRLENEFVVRAPVDAVWAQFLDPSRLATCAPGAELTEVVDDHTWKGRLTVKVGPIAMSFAGTVLIQERDDQGHRAVLKADGREQRGRGSATATVTSRLEPVGEGTRVRIETELSITGAAAQYGRGMIGDVSQRLTSEFARCLEENLAAAPQPAAGPPVRGARLALWAAWRALARLFRRLFGR